MTNEQLRASYVPQNCLLFTVNRKESFSHEIFYGLMTLKWFSVPLFIEDVVGHRIRNLDNIHRLYTTHILFVVDITSVRRSRHRGFLFVWT